MLSVTGAAKVVALNVTAMVARRVWASMLRECQGLGEFGMEARMMDGQGD